MFPELPSDLGVVSTSDLISKINEIKAFATAIDQENVTSDDVDYLTKAYAFATAASNIITERAKIRDSALSLAADLSGIEIEQPSANTDDVDPEEETSDTEEETSDTETLTASARRRLPSVRDVAHRSKNPVLPPESDRRMVTMRASANVPGFATGQHLDNFAEASRAISAQIGQYPVSRQNGIVTRNSRDIIVNADGGSRFSMRDFSRHGAIQFVRDFPEDLTVIDGIRGHEKAEYAANERRLPGGSLRESARLAVNGGRSLTAAAGWCAASDTIWDLCELESLDGLLDLPELLTTRGGWNIPANGGPDFSTIWTGLGTTHRTEAQVIAESPAKTCYDIPCHDFTDVRLGVDYFCLTGSLLQRRGYPEVVARFGRGAMTALAHKINAGVINAIVAAAGAASSIPVCATGEDAVSSLMAAIEIAIMDAKYRNRMQFSSTLEVVIPFWVLAQLRASATRRSGVDLISVADSQILEWFTTRGAVPRFVYDWQDAFTTVPTGPGGATAITALPTTVDFLVYPAGAFVKAVQPVVSLDTVYDSTKLSTNEYTAMFVEDGWAALQMCPYVRQYTGLIDPCSENGCCPS